MPLPAKIIDSPAVTRAARLEQIVVAHDGQLSITGIADTVLLDGGNKVIGRGGSVQVVLVQSELTAGEIAALNSIANKLSAKF